MESSIKTYYDYLALSEISFESLNELEKFMIQAHQDGSRNFLSIFSSAQKLVPGGSELAIENGLAAWKAVLENAPNEEDLESDEDEAQLESALTDGESDSESSVCSTPERVGAFV